MDAHALRRQGWTISAIARHLDRDRQTDQGLTFLFPTARHRYDACIDSDTVAKMIRRWVDGLPELLTDTVDKDGNLLPFDRSRIFAYAFRHTYAQRHADAGTELNTLRDLRDHKSADTTTGYFKVSMEKRRKAVETMRRHVVDRSGNPAPTPSATAYEARSVAVRSAIATSRPT